MIKGRSDVAFPVMSLYSIVKVQSLGRQWIPSVVLAMVPGRMPSGSLSLLPQS